MRPARVATDEDSTDAREALSGLEAQAVNVKIVEKNMLLRALVRRGRLDVVIVM
jgi:hypothetical protein